MAKTIQEARLEDLQPRADSGNPLVDYILQSEAAGSLVQTISKPDKAEIRSKVIEEKFDAWKTQLEETEKQEVAPNKSEQALESAA